MTHSTDNADDSATDGADADTDDGADTGTDDCSDDVGAPDRARPTSSSTAPVVKRAGDIDYEPVDAAEGLRKGVLLDESDGAPRFAMRRLELDAGASVPRHTNAIEHEQYVLAGEYVVGIDDEEHRVSPGDALLIPAGVEHWYRNDGEIDGAFVCAVPNGDDEIELVE